MVKFTAKAFLHRRRFDPLPVRGRRYEVVRISCFGGTASRTDYAGNRIYTNGRLDKILTEEGYIDFTGSTPMYHYYLANHLGNNRVVLNQNGRVEQVNPYYPFGGTKAEGVDDMDQAVERDNFSMEGDYNVSYGNKVNKSANPDEVSGGDYGSANGKEVSINLLQVEKSVSEGRNRKKTIIGTFIHEIGHNLGLDHGDNTNIMSQMDGIEFQNSIFGNSSAGTNGSQPVRSFTYPKVDSKGIKIMLQRVNAPRSNGLGIIKTR